MPLATPYILTWLTTRLKNDAALSALVDSRIEIDEAYEGIGFPYVLITVLDPGRPQYNVAAKVVTTDGIYLVRGIQEGRDYDDTLLTIAERIADLLHDVPQDLTYGIVSSVLQEEFSLLEPRNEQFFRHLGARFAISHQPIGA